MDNHHNGEVQPRSEQPDGLPDPDGGDNRAAVPDRSIPGIQGVRDRKKRKPVPARDADDQDGVSPAEIAKRVVKDALKRGLTPVCDPNDPAASKWPVLWYWTTERTWNGIEPRELPFIMIVASPEGWRVSISDSNIARRYPALCTHLEDVFPALDALLRNPESPYTEMKKGKGADKLRNQRKKDLEKQNEQG